MDLRFTPEELAFRDEVRAFIRAHLPEDIRRKLVEGRKLAKEDVVAWQRFPATIEVTVASDASDVIVNGP